MFGKSNKLTKAFIFAGLLCGPLSLRGWFFPMPNRHQLPRKVTFLAEKLHNRGAKSLRCLKKCFNKKPIRTTGKVLFGCYKVLKLSYLTIPILLFPIIPTVAAARMGKLRKFSTKPILNWLKNKSSQDPLQYLLGRESYPFKFTSRVDKYLLTEQQSIEGYAQNGVFSDNENIVPEANPIFDFDTPLITENLFLENPYKTYEV